jgi:hypothetical protein
VIENVKTGEIYRRIIVRYSNTCMSQRRAYKSGKYAKECGRVLWALWAAIHCNITCVKFNVLLDPRIPDNRKISIEKPALGMRISLKKKRCKNGLMPVFYFDDCRNLVDSWTKFIEK